MRDKRRTRRPVASPGSAAAYQAGTADWVIANEAGWGVPHGGVVLLAGVIVGARAVAWLVGRMATAVDRALRERLG